MKMYFATPHLNQDLQITGHIFAYAKIRKVIPITPSSLKCWTKLKYILFYQLHVYDCFVGQGEAFVFVLLFVLVKSLTWLKITDNA